LYLSIYLIIQLLYPHGAAGFETPVPNRYCTFSVWLLDVLGAYVGSPLYTALSVKLPPYEKGCNSFAEPPFSTSVPSTVVPFRNVICPVAADGDTVAVSVALEPVEIELADKASVVVVAVVPAGPTVTVTPLEVLAAYEAFPLKVAVSVCAPEA
jgi:hypothetical protein